MVLTKTDQEFAKRMGEQAIDALYRYRELTGERWPSYNYSLGYQNAQEWYDALCKAIEEAEKRRRPGDGMESEQRRSMA